MNRTRKSYPLAQPKSPGHVKKTYGMLHMLITYPSMPCSDFTINRAFQLSQLSQLSELSQPADVSSSLHPSSDKPLILNSRSGDNVTGLFVLNTNPITAELLILGYRIFIVSCPSHWAVVEYSPLLRDFCLSPISDSTEEGNLQLSRYCETLVF
jgi:hypothetical protein